MIFLKKLDENCPQLNIRNYSISMPTLEDAFINLSKIIKKNNNIKENLEIDNIIEYNNKILYDENNYHAKYNFLKKC